MNIFFILLLIALIYLLFKNINLKKSRNKKLNRFKKNLLSKESNIKKIFLRDDERTSSNDINIIIGLFENEIDINRKSNIHRSRLAKFKKSKLNGEIIYSDKEDKLFKYIQGKKIYLDD